MDSLHQLGQICRRHYEKIVLSIVLLILAWAIFDILSKIEVERTDLESYRRSLPGMKEKAFQPIDLSHFTNALTNAESPPNLKLTTPHNLFNPVKWQRKPDGELLKIASPGVVGPGALEVSDIRPLYLTISFKRVAGSGYFIGVERQAAELPAFRRERPLFLTPGSENKYLNLKLVQVQGTPENPTLVLEFLNSGERVSTSENQPFRRIDGYEADLKYDPENKKFSDLRVGNTITFGGESYNIVAITPTEVVISANLNNKKYTIHYKPSQ